MQIVPYLAFDGQCEEAFKFYEKCLGGRIVAMMTHGEMPASEHVPASMHNRIMHARLVAEEAELMGGDTPMEHFEKPRGFCVSVQVADPARAEGIFQALSDGATVQMPIQETFWAHRFGMLIDRYGTPWMVNCMKEG